MYAPNQNQIRLMNRFRFIIPNFFTSMSLLSAMISLNYIAKGEYILSSWFIFLSMIFDFLDGKVARKLNAMSAFGALYDTMSDFVAFGVVPGLLIYRVSLLQINPYGAIVSVLYIFSGCYRLIRFSLRSNDSSRKSSFVGLPIPIAAGFLSSTVLINIRVWSQLPNEIFMAILTLAVSFLMVSRIEYLTINEDGKISSGAKIGFVLLFLSIIVFFKHSHITFVVWLVGYIVYNPIRYLLVKYLK